LFRSILQVFPRPSVLIFESWLDTMLWNVQAGWALALAASAVFTLVSAQVTTDCNPMEKDCPPKPAFGLDYTFNFNSSPPADTFTASAGKVTYDPELGAVFTIDKQGISPTLTTNFYFFWGRTELLLKVAPGQGIISSMMWLSDTLDEVDWEFFGTNATAAQSNYFGKGEQDFHNAEYFEANGDVHDDFHNYTTIWTKDKLEWWLDGNLVRTLLPKDAKGGRNFPQTPMKLSMGIWAAGDPSMPKGTREWAGGDTDFGKAPFTMCVKSVRVEDGTKGVKEYSYGDRTGSWQSIKTVSGNSTAQQSIFKPPKESVAEKWEKLPETSKTAVYASAGGVGAVAVIALIWYCIRQRRRGRREAKLVAEAAEKERQETARYAKAGINPDSFADTPNDYRVADVSDDGKVTEKPVNVFASPFDSRPNTSEQGEKAWPMSPATPNASAMRSPVPLLQEGSQSPRFDSSGPSRPYTPTGSPYNQPLARSQAPAHAMSQRSPARGPGMPPAMGGMGPGMGPRHPPTPNRSASSPNTYMRPGPSMQGPPRGPLPGPPGPPGRPGFGPGPGPRNQNPAQLPPRSASAAPRAQNYGHPGAPDGYWNNGYR